MNNVLKKVKENLLFRIFLILTLLILAIIILFSVFYISSRKKSMHDNLTETGIILSKVLAQGSRIGTFSGSKNLLKNELKNIFQHEDVVKANVFDVKGSILSSYARPNLILNETSITGTGEINRDLFTRITSQGSVYYQEDDEKMEFWAPVYPNSGFDVVDTFFFDKKEQAADDLPTGYVRVVMGKQNLKKKIASLIYLTGLLSIVLIMLVCIIIYTFARYAQGPMAGLMKGVRALEKGDTADPIEIISQDEVGKLAAMFNTMTQALKEREEERKTIKENLETTLEEKSKKIGDLNERLHEETKEHKASLKKLYRNKEIYQKLLSEIEEGYFETDMKGRFTFFNDPFSAMTDISKNTLLGTTVFEINQSHKPETLKKLFKQVTEEQESVVLYEYKVKNETGTDRILEIRLTPHFKESKLSGIQGLSRDITKRFQEEQKQKKYEIQMLESKRIKSLELLAGGIAHEYNNLLHSIGLNLSVLSSKLELQDEFSDSIGTIEKCLIKAKRLTSKFLSFGRGGKFEAKPVSLNDIMKRTTHMYAGNRGDIDIHENLEENLHKTEADQSQIEQAILNILMNSGQAMPTGGEITIETKNVFLDEGFTSQYEKEAGNYVFLSITDTGTGMSEETLSHMFDPFYTTRGMGEGTGRGLGLASVHGTIINHNGIIIASSNPGKGTSISIYLPAIEKYKPHQVMKKDKKSFEGKKITVLLVDDDPIIRKVGKMVLDDCDYNTYTAENGLEAVNMYREKTDEIDIIILDMVMPVMSGGEAYPRFREINDDVVVLLSSGYHLDGEAKEILEQGCNGFIQKPYEIDDLTDKIHELLF